MTGTVSVVIPTYNCAERLMQACNHPAVSAQVRTLKQMPRRVSSCPAPRRGRCGTSKASWWMMVQIQQPKPSADAVTFNLQILGLSVVRLLEVGHCYSFQNDYADHGTCG